MKTFFIVLGFSLLLAACNSARKMTGNTQIKQGIMGYIKERSGKQMPSPYIPEQEGKPMKTTVYVYENTHLSQVRRKGTSAFYDTLLTKFITSAASDENGRFMIELPVGNYSLFTKMNGLFYANSFDSKNNIAPVNVLEDKITEVNITVSATASY